MYREQNESDKCVQGARYAQPLAAFSLLFAISISLPKEIIGENWSPCNCNYHYHIFNCAFQGARVISATKIVTDSILFVNAQPEEPRQVQQLSLFFLPFHCLRSQGDWSNWSCYCHYIICCCIAQGAIINVPFVTVADNILFAAELPKEPGYLEPLK